MGRQPHTKVCRERFRGLRQDEAKVRLAADKRKEFEEQQMERRRNKEEKKVEEEEGG